jgi:hypothetical protein
MRKTSCLIGMLLLMTATQFSCQQSDESTASTIDKRVSSDVQAKLVSLGFDVTNKAPFKFEDGYLVEGDIYLTDKDLAEMKAGTRIPEVEQYSTNNLVTGTPRTIKVYMSSSTFSSTYISALDVAISRYNALGLGLTFTRVTTSTGANMKYTTLSRTDENSGVLGSSGFPTSSGAPYGTIKMSRILVSTYGLSVNGIATIMAHEMGHCIGFRHTDYYNRAISCGGSTSNEGDGGIGANLIPGTPSTATNAAKSWMLACTDGGDRPFNTDDKVALNYLY